MFSQLMDEIRARGGRVRKEVLEKITRSKALNELAGNPELMRALARAVNAAVKIKEGLDGRWRALLRVLDIPWSGEVSRLYGRLNDMEKTLVAEASRRIAARARIKSARRVAAKSVSASSSPAGKTRSGGGRRSRMRLG